MKRLVKIQAVWIFILIIIIKFVKRLAKEIKCLNLMAMSITCLGL